MKNVKPIHVDSDGEEEEEEEEEENEAWKQHKLKLKAAEEKVRASPAFTLFFYKTTRVVNENNCKKTTRTSVVINRLRPRRKLLLRRRRNRSTFPTTRWKWCSLAGWWSTQSTTSRGTAKTCSSRLPGTHHTAQPSIHDHIHLAKFTW